MSELTGGIYSRVREPPMLLQTLLTYHLADDSAREHLANIPQKLVDGRAICFNTRQTVDIGEFLYIFWNELKQFVHENIRLNLSLTSRRAESLMLNLCIKIYFNYFSQVKFARCVCQSSSHSRRCVQRATLSFDSPKYPAKENANGKNYGIVKFHCALSCKVHKKYFAPGVQYHCQKLTCNFALGISIPTYFDLEPNSEDLIIT